MQIKELKRLLPKSDQILKNRSLSYLAPYLSDIRFWQFNRRSLSKAVYIGVMCAFIPAPGQMFFALLMCLYFHANVPMSVALTWISNPVTTIPLCYLAYWIGAQLDGNPVITLTNISDILASTKNWMSGTGENPLVLFQDTVSLSTFAIGMFILAMVSSLVAGIAFNLVWRYKTTILWRNRLGYRNPNQLARIKQSKKSASQ